MLHASNAVAPQPHPINSVKTNGGGDEGVIDGVLVIVGVGVGDWEAPIVGDGVTESVTLGVTVLVGVTVGVNVLEGVTVGVTVALILRVGVIEGVIVGVGVTESDGEGNGNISSLAQPKASLVTTTEDEGTPRGTFTRYPASNSGLVTLEAYNVCPLLPER